MVSRVVLPAPFGPTRATIWPPGMSSVQSRSAQVRRYRLPSAVDSMTFMIGYARKRTVTRDIRLNGISLGGPRYTRDLGVRRHCEPAPAADETGALSGRSPGKTRIADERTGGAEPPARQLGQSAHAGSTGGRAAGATALRPARARLARSASSGWRWPGRCCWWSRSGRSCSALRLVSRSSMTCRSSGTRWPTAVSTSQVLLNLLVGLACCLFILPRALLGARRLANQTRRLVGALVRGGRSPPRTRHASLPWTAMPGGLLRAPRGLAGLRAADGVAARRPGDLEGPALAGGERRRRHRPPARANRARGGRRGGVPGLRTSQRL